ncbi:hypothetical protein LTR67_005705 [Exophiala xenobiotica]
MDLDFLESAELADDEDTVSSPAPIQSSRHPKATKKPRRPTSKKESRQSTSLSPSPSPRSRPHRVEWPTSPISFTPHTPAELNADQQRTKNRRGKSSNLAMKPAERQKLFADIKPESWIPGARCFQQYIKLYKNQQDLGGYLGLPDV